MNSIYRFSENDLSDIALANQLIHSILEVGFIDKALASFKWPETSNKQIIKCKLKKNFVAALSKAAIDNTDSVIDYLEHLNRLAGSKSGLSKKPDLKVTISMKEYKRIYDLILKKSCWQYGTHLVGQFHFHSLLWAGAPIDVTRYTEQWL